MSNLDLYRLIAVNSVPRIKIGEEDRIAIAFASQLRYHSLEGNLGGVWTHVANEYSGKQSPCFGQKLKCMGKISGCADYLFLGPNGGGAIELKSEKGKQQENQILFQKWCEKSNVPYRIARSEEEGVDILKDWGLLRI